MAYTLTINLPLGQTGLTLRAQLVDTTGALVGALVTTGFVEPSAGSGYYLWTGQIPDHYQGGIVFSTAAAFYAQMAINPPEYENPYLDLIKVGTVTGSVSSLGFAGDSNLNGILEGFYVGNVVFFLSGALADGPGRKVTTYSAATRLFGFGLAYPQPPVIGDRFAILGRIEG